MNKALLLSIKPEHAIKILKGEKTLELRKSVPKGYKGWVYVYVTKGKPYLYEMYDRFLISKVRQDCDGFPSLLNGTIPFRFRFDEAKVIRYKTHFDITLSGVPTQTKDKSYIIRISDLEKAKITYEELNDYGKGNPLYAWHIKNLDIFPKPMQLSDFAKPRKSMKQENKYWIHKAPRPYMYAWVKEERK